MPTVIRPARPGAPSRRNEVRLARVGTRRDTFGSHPRHGLLPHGVHETPDPVLWVGLPPATGRYPYPRGALVRRWHKHPRLRAGVDLRVIGTGTLAVIPIRLPRRTVPVVRRRVVPPDPGSEVNHRTGIGVAAESMALVTKTIAEAMTVEPPMKAAVTPELSPSAKSTVKTAATSKTTVAPRPTVASSTVTSAPTVTYAPAMTSASSVTHGVAG